MKTAIDYTVDDLLDCQLFIASKSKRVKRNRLKSYLTVTLLSFFCAIMCFFINDGDRFVSYCFVIAGVFFLVFYPLYQRYVYKRQYRKFVEDKFKNLTDLNYQIELTPDVIHTTSKLGDMTLNVAQVEEIAEVEKYFFVKLSTGDTLTLPKRSFNHSDLSAQLTQMVSVKNIPFTKELNWNWR